MSTAASDLLSAAMSLPESDRASIAYNLLQSLKQSGDLAEDDPAFVDEIERRIEAYDRGEATASSCDEVDQRMRQALRDQKPL